MARLLGDGCEGVGGWGLRVQGCGFFWVNGSRNLAEGKPRAVWRGWGWGCPLLRCTAPNTFW